MKLVFHVLRLSGIKQFAPIAQEASRRGHDVEYWLCHKDISQTTKWYDFPSADKLPELEGQAPKSATYQTQGELLELLAGAGACVVFSHLPLPGPRPPGQIWAHLISAFFDSQVAIPPGDLDRFQILFCTTQHWVDEGLRYYEVRGQLAPDSELYERLRGKFHPVGSPLHDHFEKTNRRETMRELGLAADAKVLLVFGFETTTSFWCQKIFHEHSRCRRLGAWLLLPFSYPQILSRIGARKFLGSLWRSIRDRWQTAAQIFGCPSEKDVLRAARKYCDQNGLALVLKLRKKNPAKAYMEEWADAVIHEDSDIYPYAPAKLIDAADRVITFYSTAATESVFGRKPVINLRPPKMDFFFRDHYRYLVQSESEEREAAEADIFYHCREGGLFQFRGAIETLAVGDLVQGLGTNSPDLFHNTAAGMESYRLKHLRATPTQSSVLIVNVLENTDFKG